MMVKTRGFYFEDVEELIEYLFKTYGKLSPLKLQKGLYFLYAYYGAQYGSNENADGHSEVAYENFPRRLFNAEFQAWNYGPVIREVYFANKDGRYDVYVNSQKEFFNQDETGKEVERFVREIFDQVVEISDFSLVDRSHEDIVWQKAHKNNRSVMAGDDIVREYAEEYTQ